MQHALVDGCKLNYRMEGTRGKPVLVLSNSLGTDLAMWDRQIGALAPHFCIVRYDTRGHGASDATPGPYSIERLGRDVIGLLDHLQAARASVCGVSLGGMTAMWLGANAADRVDRLVLANTSPRMAPADMWNQRIANVEAGGMAAISDGVLARWFTPAFAEREPETIRQMKAMMERQSPQGYVACCAAVRDMDQRESLSRIRAPALVIAGTHDAATPPWDAKLIADAIEGARMVEIDAAHISNIEAAGEFDAAIVPFLTEAP